MQFDWKRIPPGVAPIATIDAHAAGEPLRIVTSELPDIQGQTMLERRNWFRENLDWVRRAIMHEPRGHRDMYGCVVTPPVTPETDLGVLFMHNEGYSTMCGHGIIALVATLLETGTIESTDLAIDTPAGLVRATADVCDGRVRSVSFLNVPSFVYQRDVEVTVKQLGTVTLDIAFGGAFYAVLAVSQWNQQLDLSRVSQLVANAEEIKRAINETIKIQHPIDDDLGFLYGVILTGPPENAEHHSRNLCVFANAEVDRSPTGTGVSARLAIHHAKGEIQPGESIQIESILGEESVFEGRVAELTTIGPFDAVVPEISGRAFVTGHSEFVVHPDDALGQGFLL